MFIIATSSSSTDLQLPMQSVHITTKVVSSNLARGEVYSIQHYVIIFASDLWFSLDTTISFINETDRHDIAEILLKVALSTIHQTFLQDVVLLFSYEICYMHFANKF